MIVQALDRDSVTVSLTTDELLIVANALNEVVNALSVEDVAIRIGAELSELERLQAEFAAIRKQQIRGKPGEP